MLDNVPAVVPPQVAAAQPSTPAPEAPPPAGETSLPLPTVEQAQVADHLFTAPHKPHAAMTLFGVLTSAMVLRDVAVDTFAVSDEEEDEKKRASEPEA